MKTKVFMLAILMMMGAGSLFAKNKSEKFLVNGKCEMCEKRIEMAALSVEGVSKADWNKETKEINVTFNDAKTSLQDVKTAITKVGHDTDAVKATDEAYNELPSCCKYDRADLKAPMKPMIHKHQ
ncbi:MAG: heavy-metal-associated domain-containing protein [Prolixibacteraceae bacterium]|jgi:copper chaperone CopZ